LTAKSTVSDSFEALANPRRRAIIALLSSSPMSLRQIANELPITRQAVSGHLRFLSSAGLVAHETADNRRFYRLDRAGAVAAREYLEQAFGIDGKDS
jgi:predicted ArsR family transcriptional regulator